MDKRCVQENQAQLRPSRLRAEVLNGLHKTQKELPSKYLYDRRGSQLFERICTLPEYYLTRTEAVIMDQALAEITQALGTRVGLLDFGSGNSAKARKLLAGLTEPAAYVPIDISREHLFQVARQVDLAFPSLEVLPVCADYTSAFPMPQPKAQPERWVAFYPGSTIGNFDPVPAQQFLSRIADLCGPGGALLISVDLVKSPEVLHRAYNDAQGVTAAFNLNLLRYLNRALGADFDLDGFAHYAPFNPRESRVEMHLVSLKDLRVHIGGHTIHCAQGESIWTESSYKYNLERFRELVGAAGFRTQRVWTDERAWFSVHYLTVV